MSNPWIKSERPLVIAHRGNSIAAPENTLPAYESASQLGVDMIETDLNISKDGVLVMMHDWYMGRTTDIQGAIQDLTIDELRKVDAGSWKGKEFTGVRIPTTEEALAFAKKAGIYMCFEVKGSNPKRANVIAEKLVELFKKYDAFDWAFMSSYHHDALALAKKAYPQLMLSPERLPDDVEPDIDEALRQVHRLGAEALQIHHRYLYPDFLKAMRQADISLWAWPATTEEEIIKSIQSGADGVMGDDPKLAIELVNKLRPAK
jgi:glycerophosphoryl diester phosphodiesterase